MAFDPRLRFLTLASVLILSFTIQNYLQELLTTVEGFSGGTLLGYLEVSGLALCTLLEATVSKASLTRKAPWSSYLALCGCLLVSSVCSSWSLDYINYPTKVAVRSCKVPIFAWILLPFLNPTICT